MVKIMGLKCVLFCLIRLITSFFFNIVIDTNRFFLCQALLFIRYLSISEKGLFELLSDAQKIENYLKRLSPDLIEMQSIASIEILKMTPGSYNLNFHVRVNQKEFNFRINIDQQSGLDNQIEYEYKTLKFLESHGIAPRVFFFDDSCRHFDFAIMVQEYLIGPHLSLSSEDIFATAELLARLHSLNPFGGQFLTWNNPLEDTYNFVQNDVCHYEEKKSHDRKTLRMAKEIMKRIEPMIPAHRHLFHSDSLNHTDVGLDNFIKSPQGLRLIDWEKPRVDDCTYDICCFLSEPAELWCTQKVLNHQEHTNFIEAYARFSGKDANQLRTKVRIREPLVSLHWILWGAAKLCDLKERITSPQLLEAHIKKKVRYRRIANPENIEKILDSLG